MSRKDEKKKSEPGLGTVIAAGAVVAVGAGLMYGAKKLFDFWNESQQQQQQQGRGATSSSASAQPSSSKCCDDSSDSDSDYPHEYQNSCSAGGYDEGATGFASSGAHQRESGQSLGARPKTSSQPQLKSLGSMSSQLHEYYDKYVKVDPSRATAAADVVHEVKDMLSKQLGQFLPRPLSAVLQSSISCKEVGSAVDGTQAINADEFDVLVLLNLSESDWSAEQNSATSGDVLLAALNKDLGSAVCNENDYLLASEITELLRAALRGVLNIAAQASFVIEVSNDFCTFLQLSVCYIDHSVTRNLRINLIPAVKINDRCFVPLSSLMRDPATQIRQSYLYWTRVYAEEELLQMNKLGPYVSAHRTLLSIVKAIRLNFPQQFGLLSSYQYKTILMRLLDDQPDEGEWSRATLSERFIDFLVELGSSCKEKMLPSYFDPSINLFERMEPEALVTLSTHVNRLLGTNNFQDLLEESHFEKI